MRTTVNTNSDAPTEQPRLAVLIDADNAQPGVIGGLLEEVARYGVASVRRIYGDFTSQQQSGWKKVLLKHSIQPVQQFAYTTGKNATDSALIIDAMDLLHARRFNGFCLVSSDSDFTRLAQRLREEGLSVYGFGERKTPDAFVQACDRFVYVDLLRQSMASAEKPQTAEKPTVFVDVPPVTSTAATGGQQAASAPAVPPTPIKLIRQAIEEASDDAGWAHLGAVGNYLSTIRSDFDSRLYGHKKLSDLIRSEHSHFELEERGLGSGAAKSIYVRSRH